LNKLLIKRFAFKVGAFSVAIGVVAFLISWYLFDGNMPGYRVALFPGNLFLLLFTEELAFGTKLVLLLAGQFLVSALSTLVVLKAYFR
jgi:hypothetical protein